VLKLAGLKNKRRKKTRWGAGFLVTALFVRTLSLFSSREISKGIHTNNVGETKDY
jgi:hypothetical protein